MKNKLPFIFCSLLICMLAVQPAAATRILRDLNFSSGSWTLVGVPLHNYKMLPIQEDLGTFVMKNDTVLLSIKQKWDLDLTYEDKCDYHYALKFYRNDSLIRTLKLNLHCGYLTYDGWSYIFNPAWFEEIRQAAYTVDWSRISFSSDYYLREAILRLDTTAEVYWYNDVKPFLYPGFFILGINGLPWNTDVDSLHRSVDALVRSSTSSNSYYLKPHYHIIYGDYLNVRYLLNCEESFADQYPLSNKFTNWRSHFAHTDSVRIVAIGINKEKYRQLMRE